MTFKNRTEAGRQLAAQLAMFTNRKDVLVLGIPRGGVVVAYEVAAALHVPLDIFLSRKLGAPGNPELAFGALAANDGRFLDEGIIAALGITQQQIDRITAQTRELLEERARMYREGRAALPVTDKIVILVDDGIATGASIYAAIHALRQMKPKELIVAVPVAPRSTCGLLRSEVDLLTVLNVPDEFYAVGQFYQDFQQTSDESVIELLGQSIRSGEPQETHSEISIPLGKTSLHGTLTIPRGAKGLIIFAHGSGSSRYSPRNRYVAEELQSRGLGTLLFDLLTPEEEQIDTRTAALRFNIPLLADRLVGVTEWLTNQGEVKNLPMGYFGASTGAAAALVAAAREPDLVKAVVSRGGRPDLAQDALSLIPAETLLIVGSFDDVVLEVNRQALSRLNCEHKQLVIVPRATHLFEEPGALEQVAGLAADWFLQSLSRPSRSNVYLAAAK